MTVPAEAATRATKGLPGSRAETGGAAAPGAISVGIARPGEEEAIEAFVAAHPAASVYHRPAFARVLRSGGGLAVATFVARRAAAASSSRPIAGIVPVALTQSRLFGTYATSLPFFNYGGVLAEDRGAGGRLVEAAWAWARGKGARHLVLRHTADRKLDLPETHGKETLTLPLPAGDPDRLFASIGSKTRNLVRKAERAGLEACVETARAVPAFHSVLSENMRDLGSPFHGQAFFRVLLEELRGSAEIHVVRAGPRVAAAALTIRWRDRVEVPWASCRRRYNAVSANMLLYWHMLRRATLAGARLFDFGRSTKDSGPYRFKLQWGARPEPLPWYFVAPGGRAPTGDLSPKNPRYALAIRLWQRMPIGLTRVVGAYLAEGLP